jgi:hypothetical protein
MINISNSAVSGGQNGELREFAKSKEPLIASLRDQGYLICGPAHEINTKQGNVSNPLSAEVLCLPSEQVEEARKTVSKLHLKGGSQSHLVNEGE